MKALGTALAYAVYILIALLVLRWMKNNVTQKARDNYTKARQWATDKRAEMATNRRPDPPPSSAAAKVGAAAGGLVEGARLAWRAGWPGFRLGYPQGRQAVYDWWTNRHEPEAARDAQPAIDEPKPAKAGAAQGGDAPKDLTLCPTCGYDLAMNGWPLGHNDPHTGQPCGYDWREDDRWHTCPRCGGLYPPGIDKCGECDFRVAVGPTRFDPAPETPEDSAPESPQSEQGGSIMPTSTVPTEIRTIADLREAAKATAQQAQAELQDTETAAARAKSDVEQAQVEMADAQARISRAREDLAAAQRVAEAAARILDNDPQAAAAQAAVLEPRTTALRLAQEAQGTAEARMNAASAAQRAAQDARANAEATYTAASAALRILQTHGAAEQVIGEMGGRASSRTDAYAA